MERRPIIIVGSGPAGIATALSLWRLAPELASELVILEKEKHPRPKLCGGGITPYGDELLQRLDIIADVPSIPIHKVCFYFDANPLNFCRPNLMRIVQRDAFDACLARRARAAGLQLEENQRVIDIRRSNGQIQLRTPDQTYETKVLIGADGANGIVRRKMLPERGSRISRLVEALIKVDADSTEEYRQRMAVFDFRLFQKGINGYAWDFPSFVEREAYLNIGVFDSGVRNGGRPDLRKALLARLTARGLPTDQIEVKGHPERCFTSSGIYSQPNVLLVGDAAGVEPWLGEGISLALAYGAVAAAAVREAFTTNDFSFDGYRKAILSHKLGKLMQRNRRVARLFYTQPSQRVLARAGKLWESYFDLRAESPEASNGRPALTHHRA